MSVVELNSESTPVKEVNTIPGHMEFALSEVRYSAKKIAIVIRISNKCELTPATAVILPLSSPC